MNISVKTFDQLNTRELYEILKVRTAVFVVEQNCPYQDIDDVDPDALHIFMRDETGVKAYLRVFSKDERTAHIGRVLTTERGCGYGGEILKAGIHAAREQLHKSAVYLEAQTYATGFYEREGFRTISDEFLEDGIPHIQMLLEF